MTRVHGGDRAAFQPAAKERLLDFSANGNPLGIPDPVREAAVRALENAAEYPDPQCRALRRALGERLGVPEDQILCGNGASDLIFRAAAALKPRAALVPVPGFSEYEAALRAAGCVPDEIRLREENGFLLTVEVLDRITEQTDAVFLCQPNNPTGRSVDPGLLRRVLARCRRCGSLLILDECFLDFLENGERCSLLDELEGGRLLILRAFTKFRGLAGLRLGYALCAETGLLQKMAEAGPPWPVSSAAQAAGIASLGETEQADRLRRLVREERPFLREGLEDCGCRVIPGEANFLLFYHEDRLLAEKLLQHGILIRDCSSFRGLEKGWYRAAVRTHPENCRLLQVMREVSAAWQNGS